MKSRGWQWVAWGALALVALVIAAVWSYLATGRVSAGYFCPPGNRWGVAYFALFVYLAWEMRCNEVEDACGTGLRSEVEEKKVEVIGRGRELSGGGSAVVDSNSVARPIDNGRARSSASLKPSDEDAMTTGEELFNQARALPHRRTPDFKHDRPYLELLGRSAEEGHAPAMAKLGEYAMRRAAWVEAYYWMKQAQRRGMGGLTPTLRQIRIRWSQGGFRNETQNVNPLFGMRKGSLGRALLHVDSGHEAAKAREFLRATHPEYLEN